MRFLLVLGAVCLSALAIACSEDESLDPEFGDFNEFALEVADAIALGDLERVVAATNRVRFTCDEQLAQTLAACANVPVGEDGEGFDVRFKGRSGETTVLDSAEIRLLLDGMFNPDATAPADDVGGPDLELYSTLHPDPTLFFPGDEGGVPERGTLAITYIGVSPGEKDMTVQRRLFAAVAERDGEGRWKIRLWLVGFYTPDHPALHPGEGNAYERFVPPEF